MLHKLIKYEEMKKTVDDKLEGLGGDSWPGAAEDLVQPAGPEDV